MLIVQCHEENIEQVCVMLTFFLNFFFYLLVNACISMESVKHMFQIVHVSHYTKYSTYCHLLLVITPCYTYLMHISLFANYNQFGCLDIREHQHLHTMSRYQGFKKVIWIPLRTADHEHKISTILFLTVLAHKCRKDP